MNSNIANLVKFITEMDEDLFRTVEEYLILVKEYRKAFDLNLRVGNSSQVPNPLE